MSLVKQVILLFSTYIFKYSNEDGKMTQLKSAHAGDPGLSPNNHMVAYSCPAPVSGDPTLAFCLCGHYTCFQCTCIHAGRIHTHISHLNKIVKYLVTD